jgi:hypothetical protein
VDNDQTIPPASPAFMRVAALAGWLFGILSAAVAAYAYVSLAHPSTVIHLGRHGEMIESIESYIFSGSFLQILLAFVLTIKWVRFSADLPRIAEREQRRRAHDPRARPENLDAMYRIFCVVAVAFQVFCFSVTVYRAAMIATNNL